MVNLLKRQLLGAMVSLIIKCNNSRKDTWDNDSKEFTNKSIYDIESGFSVVNSQSDVCGVGFRVVVKDGVNTYTGYLTTKGEVIVEDGKEKEFVEVVFNNFDKNNYSLKMRER